MSNIRYDDNSSHMAVYKELLQAKIYSVCQSIEFDDEGISWVIFNAKKAYPDDIIGPILVGRKGSDYGFFDPRKGEIGISIEAIQRGASVTSMVDTIAISMFKPSKRDDFLADVLLDEITHYQTGANHGTPKYDDKLRDNRRRYYDVHL